MTVAFDSPIRGKLVFGELKHIILLIGVFSTYLAISNLLILYRRNHTTTTTINNDYPTYHYTAAVCLALVRLTITCIAYGICIVKERTRDGEGDNIDDEDDSRMRCTKTLKAYKNVLIGLARVVALLGACLEFTHVSERSAAAKYSIEGSLIGTFCMTEFLYLLQKYGVIHPAIQSDLGYFKFVIAAALCAFQKMYGCGIHMAYAVISCMLANMLSGVVLTSASRRDRDQGSDLDPTQGDCLCHKFITT